MRKKLILLTLMAAVMLDACAVKAGTEGERNDQEAVQADEPAIAEEDAKPAIEEEEKEQLSEAETAEESVAQEKNASEFSKGTVTESGWESEWLGLRYTAPEGARMSTEEELEQLMGISEELLSEDLSKAQLKYAELISVREMMCYDEVTKSNVIVNVDRMPLKLSVEDYSVQLELSLNAISAVEYEKQGEDETVEIAGIPYLKSTYRVEGMGQIMQTEYYVRIIDDRVVSLVVTCGEGNEEQADSLLGGFTAY